MKFRIEHHEVIGILAILLIISIPIAYIFLGICPGRLCTLIAVFAICSYLACKNDYNHQNKSY